MLLFRVTFETVLIRPFSAGLGGIYSLFIGMSVITFFEVLFFSTVRLREAYLQNKRDSLPIRIRVYGKRAARPTRMDIGQMGAA